MDDPGNSISKPVGYGIEVVVGGALFACGLFAPREKKAKEHRPKGLGPVGVFAAGVASGTVEMTIALPYLGAIGIMTRERFSIPRAAVVLVVHNIVFIAPCLLLLLALQLFRKQVQDRFQRYLQKHQEKDTARKAALVAAAVVGFLLLRDGLVMLYYDHFGLSQFPEDVRRKVNNT